MDYTAETTATEQNHLHSESIDGVRPWELGSHQIRKLCPHLRNSNIIPFAGFHCCNRYICFGMLDKIATAEQTLTSTRRRIITSKELRFENATSVDPFLSHVAHLRAFVCTCGIGKTITSKVFRQLKNRMVAHSGAEVDHLERLLWGPTPLLQ